MSTTLIIGETGECNTVEVKCYASLKPTQAKTVVFWLLSGGMVVTVHINVSALCLWNIENIWLE